MNPNVSFAQRVSRLGARLRTPEWRRYGSLLLLGKLVGISLWFCSLHL